MIPAPAPVSEAPAPLVNWQTLLGLSPQTTANNTTTSYASSTLHPPMTPQKALVTTPPPGLTLLSLFDFHLFIDPMKVS